MSKGTTSADGNQRVKEETGKGMFADERVGGALAGDSVFGSIGSGEDDQSDQSQ
jgi:hypothetical protein